VPQYILEYHASRGLHCNIICTQPRKIAAISISKRVCHERGWQVGTMVGYQVSLDKVASEDTRLLFVTTGILLQKLINQKDMNEFTHVILDEVHERDLHTDFVMLISKYLLQTNSARTKLVLMSATFDASLFSNYFNVYQEGLLTPAPIVSVGGKNFPVMEFYLEDLRNIITCTPQSVDDPKLAPDCVELAARLLKRFDYLEANQDKRSGTIIKGTVLVFLPGLPEIITVDKVISDSCTNVIVLPLHSTIGVEEQQKVFVKPPEGYRKVILSTNIAESSITVPDIRYVIDFCLVKELMNDPSTNYQCLRIAWASKASMMQRRGRAGRVAEGRVYRLISREFYRECREYTQPEIKRCPLEGVVLQTKVLDIGAPVEVLSMSLEQPEALDIERTVLLLKEIGALSSSNMDPFDGELTFLGRVCERLPIDIRMGKLLLLGYVFGILEECLVIAASLSVRSFFSRPYSVELKAYRSKVRWAQNSFSDPIAMLYAYREWYREKCSGKWDNDRNQRIELEWCRKNFIQCRRINDAHELVKELFSRLSRFNIQSNRSILSTRTSTTSSHDVLMIKLVMAGAFYPHYFRWSEVDEQEAERSLSGHDPHTTVMISGLPLSRYNDLQYTGDIVKCFEECGRIKQIHYDSSRAYIEFQRLRLYSDEWDSALSVSGNSLIVPSVYTALKMRQLKNGTITILLNKPADKHNTDDTQSKQLIRTPSPQLSLTPPPYELKRSGEINLLVTEVVTAGHFWGQEVSEESRLISLKISEQISRLTVFTPLINPSVDKYCMAVFPPDGLYYRGKLMEIDRSNRTVTIHYMDFGNMEILTFDQIYEIPLEILSHPTLGIECFLAKIKPSFKESSDGYYSHNANMFFSNLASQKVLRAKIYSQVEGTLRVFLYTNDSEELINKLLLDKGYALPAEESYQSMSAHEKAQEPEYTFSDHFLDDKHQESSPPRFTQHNTDAKLYLKGPSSPYEVSFYSLTKIGLLKSARIERESVNSVCLHYEPQDKHERLMVSAFVALNSTATSVIARETTLMPNINGLIYIITLLFAPFVELRTDELKRSFIGALCGLGYDSLMQPYFPEHDISLTFDTQITPEDIAQINSIRTFVNTALKCNQDFKIPWNDSFVRQNQAIAKQQLLDLVIKDTRPSIEVTHFPKAYTWGRIELTDLINNNDDTNIGDGLSLRPIYSLLNSVRLTVYDPSTYCVPTRVLIMRRKMIELQNLATCSQIPIENLFCELCNARCQTPAELTAHISSRQHILSNLELMDNSIYQ
ncbi:tudor domain containing protein 9 TDRD9, partial [Oopsacas minuta]